MAHELENLRERLHVLRSEGRRVAESLDSAAESMHEHGTPPSDPLIEQLAALRQELLDLQNELRTELKDPAPNTIDAMERAIDAHARATSAEQVLQQVLSLQHQDRSDFEPLVNIQRAAIGLASQLQVAAASRSAEVSDQLDRLAQGSHIWCALLQLAQRGPELSDEDWSRLNEQVEEQLGHPIAIAAARGRLLLTGNTVDKPSAPSSLTPPSNRIAPSTEAIAAAGTSVDPATNDPSEPESERETETASRPAQARKVLPPEAEVASTELGRDQPGEAVESLHSMEATGTASESIADERADVLDLESADFESDVVNSAAVDADAATAIETPGSTKPTADESIFDEIGTVSSERAELAKFRRGDQGLESPVPHLPATREGFAPHMFDDDVETVLDSADNGYAETESQSVEGDEIDQYEVPDAELKRMAEVCLSCSGTKREAAIAELIWQLIYEGRVGMAWHLSRGLEAKDSRVRYVPAWLISAWATGLWILYPKGQLATRLADDLEHFTEAEFARRVDDPDENEWLRVLSLLTRAATLRGAIIAPGTRAAAIVRAFPLREGEETLYNYCSRIGANGEKLNGFFPGVLKQQLTEEGLQEELRLLQNEVRRWRQETTNWAIRFEPAKPLFYYGHWSLRFGTALQHPEQLALWPKWMHTLGLADEILSPILEDSVADLVRVRAAVDRLSTRVVVGSANDYPSGTNVIAVPIPEMRRILREATTFAHRWLTLRSRGASDSAGFLPQAAESLIADVQQRHDDLFEELQQNVAESDSSEFRTATACLMLAAQQVKELLDSRTPLQLQEPDVRHLLHAELLRFPDLNLDSDWLPDVPPIALSDRLLIALTKPQPDWLTTFRLHEKRQDHIATERLLMLNVWSESQRQELSARRQEKLRIARQQLTKSLHETAKLVREAADQKRLSLQEVPVIDAAIEDLEYRIERSAGIGNLSRQLNRLRGHVDQRLPASLRKPLDSVELTDSSGDRSVPPSSLGSSLVFDDND